MKKTKLTLKLRIIRWLLSPDRAVEELKEVMKVIPGVHAHANPKRKVK